MAIFIYTSPEKTGEKESISRYFEDLYQRLLLLLFQLRNSLLRRFDALLHILDLILQSIRLLFGCDLRRGNRIGWGDRVWWNWRRG
jgi:hypothetical protein